MRASAREGNKHAREQFFLTICGGGDLTICILLPAPPPSATRTKISCSRAYSYPLGRLPFLTVIKRDSHISSAAVCNIPAPIRPSAVRNSNKNLLLSGVFLPSRALAFSDSYKKGFVYVRGGSMPISLRRFDPPPSATRTKISCSRAYSYPPGRLPF